MKHLLNILLISCSLLTVAQKRPDPLKQISKADTIVFTSKLSGCFSTEAHKYTLVRSKKEHLVISSRDSAGVVKKLSPKNFDAFISKYRSSVTHFREREDGKRCTLVVDFKLCAGADCLPFSNTTCEAAFNPEELLQKLIK